MTEINKKCGCQNQPIDLETKFALFEGLMEISDDKKTPTKNERINHLLRASFYNSLAQEAIKKYEQ